MSRSKRTAIHVSPTAPLLLALFVMVSSPLLLAALLLAAVLHELGHYWMLRRLRARVTALRITALGAEMQVAGRLSYGGEVLAAAAGPAVNLLLALLLGLGGRLCEALYLFSGAQLVLGAFNLLPIPPLDGSKIVAYFLPPRAAWAYMSAGRYGFIILVLLLATGLLGHILGPLIGGGSDLLLSLVGIK